jgi:hypothetical protein
MIRAMLQTIDGGKKKNIVPIIHTTIEKSISCFAALMVLIKNPDPNKPIKCAAIEPKVKL